MYKTVDNYDIILSPCLFANQIIHDSKNIGKYHEMIFKKQNTIIFEHLASYLLQYSPIENLHTCDTLF